MANWIELRVIPFYRCRNLAILTPVRRPSHKTGWASQAGHLAVIPSAQPAQLNPLWVQSKLRLISRTKITNPNPA